MEIEPVPEGFLGRLLEAFGLQWTHLVVISGVVFSSFHLESYLNPGVWILGTILAFSLVYLFRHNLHTGLPRVALLASLALLVGVAAPLGVLLYQQLDIGKFLQSWTAAGTAYLSLVIGVPVGFVILSYRNQDELQRQPLPPALARAVKHSVANADFYHEHIQYRIQLRQEGRSVVMRFDITMRVVNRRKTAATYRDIFDPAGREKRFLAASINGKSRDARDPDYLSNRGLLLSHDAAPNEHFTVEVSGESSFHDRDSELVGAYLPCESFSIHVDQPPAGLSVNIQSLLPRKVDVRRLDSGDLLFDYPDGVLPFQGTRIFWERRGGLGTEE